MKRQSTSGGKVSKARRRKGESRRTSSTVVGGRGSVAHDLQKQLDDQARELAEARRQLAEALEQRTEPFDSAAVSPASFGTPAIEKLKPKRV